MVQIKPFRFRLIKISKKEQEIVQGLLEYLPASGVREQFHVAIRKAVQKYLSDIRYYLERIDEKLFHDFFVRLPSPCCVGVIGMKPFEEKAFVELDPLLSYLMIEKLLGGKGNNREALSPLTETEQGVIEFLLLKILSEIHKLCGEKAKMHFRLEGMVLEPAHLKKYEKQKPELICLKVHVSLLGRSGFVNLYLPHPWVLDGFLKAIPKERGLAADPSMQENLKSFDSFPVEIRGELGVSQVGYRDYQNLEEGDVVLFDTSGLTNRSGGWSGSVEIHAGSGESGGFQSHWDGFQDKGHVVVQTSLSKG